MGRKGKVIQSPPAKLSETRPFTNTSDMLILQSIIEDRASIREIAVLLGRDPEEIRERIIFLKRSGRLKQIHKSLMQAKGVYAMKYIRRKKMHQKEG